MKKIICAILLLTCLVKGFCQNGKSTWIAPFNITTPNGVYTYKQLKKDMPVILIYFSPTCGHCQAFTAELLKHKAMLSKKQIVMVTCEPLQTVKAFCSTYGLGAYPNITVGTEGESFIVRYYYQVHNFPFVVVYNGNRKLTAKEDGETDPVKLTASIL